MGARTAKSKALPAFPVVLAKSSKLSDQQPTEKSAELKHVVPSAAFEVCKREVEIRK